MSAMYVYTYTYAGLEKLSELNFLETGCKCMASWARSSCLLLQIERRDQRGPMRLRKVGLLIRHLSILRHCSLETSPAAILIVFYCFYTVDRKKDPLPVGPCKGITTVFDRNKPTKLILRKEILRRKQKTCQTPKKLHEIQSKTFPKMLQIWPQLSTNSLPNPTN